jgi:hypothetical protein
MLFNCSYPSKLIIQFYTCYYIYGILFYISYHKIYKKNIVIFKDIRLKPYHRAELIIVAITGILCSFEVFLEQWKEPGQRGNDIPIFIAGVCYLAVPFFLEQLVLNPQEKKRKRGYIFIVAFEVIGLYMTFCFIYNWLVLFGIVC